MGLRFLPAFALLTALQSQPAAVASRINGIAVEEKVNGTVIHIQTTGTVSASQVTAWVSESGWLYVTLLETTIDTSRRWPVLRTEIVSRFEAHTFPNAVQLDFRVSHPIESVDIDTSPSGEEVIITLRFPVTEVLGSLDRLKSRRGREVETGEGRSKPVVGQLTGRLPQVLILAGSGLVLGGLIESNGPEFVGGAAILVAGYISLKRAATGKEPGS